MSHLLTEIVLTFSKNSEYHPRSYILAKMENRYVSLIPIPSAGMSLTNGFSKFVSIIIVYDFVLSPYCQFFYMYHWPTAPINACQNFELFRNYSNLAVFYLKSYTLKALDGAFPK